MNRPLTAQQKDFKRLKELLIKTGIIGIISFYVALRVGYFFHINPCKQNTNAFLENINNVFNHFFEHPLHLYPNLICMIIAFLTTLIVFALMYDKYTLYEGTDDKAQGTAYFETDYAGYNKEFVYDPKIIEKITGHKFTDKEIPRNSEGKKVIKENINPEKRKWHDAVEECKRQSIIYSDKIYLSLNGGWCQRNTNSMVFGASGTGKSRYFLKPNILQNNGSFVCTDPSSDILQETGYFLKQKGYIIKSFNISDMTKSCRFNPLYYIRDVKDIAIIVQTFIDNMKQGAKSSGDGDFWDKSMKAQLCATIGYLYEVCPIEQRNWSNVLNILRMDKHEDGEEPGTKSEYDELFEELGAANPISYAYAQYKIYTQAPVETRNNILISTSVNLQQLDIPEVKNLTYKDEMELDMIGHKKIAIFLNIPQADTTFSWLTAMLYSMLFKRLYAYGETRMNLVAEKFDYDAYLDYLDDLKNQDKEHPYKYVDTSENRELYKQSKEFKPFKGNLGAPEMKIPVRFLIDECANVGKIPNLDNYLATCRKYKITICPIFQNYSQIVEIYGKEKANSILSNCDAFLFLGGFDGDTMKIIQDRLGKTTTKTLSDSISHSKGSNSTSKQQVGQDLMSRDQVETMSNADCVLFIRALHPFHTKKYDLTKHPNYHLLSEGKDGEAFVNPFSLIYEDEEIEANRVKPIGVEGHITPKIVDSACRRSNIKKYTTEATDILNKLDEKTTKLNTETLSDSEIKTLKTEIASLKDKLKELSKQLPVDVWNDLVTPYQEKADKKEISDETKLTPNEDVTNKLSQIKHSIITNSYDNLSEFDKADDDLVNDILNNFS